MSGGCPAFVGGRKNRGSVCGRPITGFVARGHGRCGYHLTDAERIRVLAVIRAERELRSVLTLEPRRRPEECERQPEARCDDGPHAPTGFDVERFSSPDLDE